MIVVIIAAAFVMAVALGHREVGGWEAFHHHPLARRRLILVVLVLMFSWSRSFPFDVVAGRPGRVRRRVSALVRVVAATV